MRHTEDIQIDDRTYSATHYTTTKGNKIKLKLMKIFGKPLGVVIGEFGAEVLKGGKIGDTIKSVSVNGQMVGDLFAYMASSLTPDEFVDLQKEILEGVYLYDNGSSRPIVYDNDFCGMYEHLYKLLWKVLVFQFDFLQKAGSVIQTLPAQTGSRIQAK